MSEEFENFYQPFKMEVLDEAPRGEDRSDYIQERVVRAYEDGHIPEEIIIGLGLESLADMVDEEL